MIATSQPLASAAGLEVFRNGGNAIDAAVTAAGVLAVVEPTMTGIGGDLFAIVHDGTTDRTRGLNASGRSPHGANLDRLHALGHTTIPEHGVLSVTVPGAVDGWSVLLAEYGTVSLREALAPAIACARDGFPVAEVVARQWRVETPKLAADAEATAMWLPGGRAPEPGEIFGCPALAASLATIAAEGRDAFYRGELGRAIVRDSQRRGGWLTAADLSTHRSEWVDPIRATHQNIELLELPPNTQGFVALEALNILGQADLARMGTTRPTTCICSSKRSPLRSPTGTRISRTPPRSPARPYDGSSPGSTARTGDAISRAGGPVLRIHHARAHRLAGITEKEATRRAPDPAQVTRSASPPPTTAAT